MSFLSLWLFVWDDEIDEYTGTLSADFEASQQYRQDTIDYVSYTLGFTPDGSTHSQRISSRPPNTIIRSFDVIGKALLHAYNIGKPPYLVS